MMNSTQFLMFINLFFHWNFVESIDYKSFRYQNFSEDDENFFKFQGPASSVYNGALQLTPESINQAFRPTHLNKSGRIMYPEPFTLWSSSSSSLLASFNTSFVINLYRDSDWDAGDGLAFLIAPNISGLPDGSFGKWLGLTNSSTDSNPNNYILAVEFDTQKQNGVDEIEADHIGININSVKSEVSASLSDQNITLSPPPPGANYKVWIDYNGKIQLMEVYMVKEGNSKPRNPILNHTVNLKQYLKQESYFGFAASTGDPHIELNCVLKWEFQIENLSEENGDKLQLKIGIGVGVGIGILSLIMITVLCVRIRKKMKSAAAAGEGAEEDEREMGKQLRWLPGMAREFKYEELKKATSDFHESKKLGEGGFGIVYKGEISESEIAVKKFCRDNIKGRKEDFLAELQIIHRLRHKHLVRLVGWCYEKGKLILVYDYMPNGSLEKHLYEASSDEDTLNWSRRCKVLAGVASALHYLHIEYDQVVIHRDLKASNILLDKDFNARLGDFGLARALENEKNSYAELGVGGVPGTFGYVAPECFHTGKASPESDVFSFGAVILEVLCGKGPGIKIHHNQHLYSLVDWVWMLHREGRIQEAVDEKLENDFVEDEAKRLLLLGLACSHPTQSSRPKTQDLLQIISGASPVPHVPPFRPVFMWPSMSNADNTDTSLSGITLSTQNSGRSSSLTMVQMTTSQPAV
ncbi:probable L-type lectin-domain containing receptor kinase S.5 [Euphorbia lathyris]|uniref:probable L-type lectin-domain containing receptor kinase S.5 n=1 Tax=Euphorbia lathyris TaxID=212925 RepID=UPI0033134088